MTNLARVLPDTPPEHADRVAIRQGDLTLSFAGLTAAAGQVATFLRKEGIGDGDRVAVMLPNLAAFPVLAYGVLAAGAVLVPMNPLLKGREVEHYLGDSGAGLIFAWEPAAGEAVKGAVQAGARVVTVADADAAAVRDGMDPAADWADKDDGDDAVILYTSGTTGTPKGAQLTHGGLRRNAEITARSLLRAGSDDVVMGCLPLFHVFGLTCGLNMALISHACLTLLPRFDAGAALEMISRDKVTVFEGVPTMYSALLHHPGREQADVSSLRVCVSGGAALPVEVLRGFEEAFGCMILEGYGLSETSPVASFNHPDAERKPGSIGTPIEGVEMRLVDSAGADVPAGEVGEIAIRGHNVMKGYWGRPEATAEAIPDGWFRTGDLARTDSDGYFFIVDRKKEMIIRGGYNVYPREIEEALYEHPAVREVAVVGIPHDSLGEEVGAAVALKPGASVTVDELQAFAKDRVAAYKYPRLVWLVDELPKGPTGKILRRSVKPPQQ